MKLVNSLFLVLIIFSHGLRAIFKDAPLKRQPSFTYMPDRSVITKHSIYNFLPMAAPDIGIYGTPYDFLTLLCLIELDPEMLQHKIPAAIQNELAKAQTIYSFIQIRVLKPNKVYNVVFHFFYEMMSGIKQFDYYMPMGLFDPNNVKETGGGSSIPVNRFEKRQLNTHPGGEYAVSPNNALFEVIELSKPAAFWLAGIVPEKKAISISYVILLPPGNIEKEIYRGFDNGAIRSVKNFMVFFKESTEKYIAGTTKTLYERPFEQILRILTVQPKNEIEKLQMQLVSLKEQLMKLQNKLALLR